jgi:transglutaminase-like putative cysteine protease
MAAGSMKTNPDRSRSSILPAALPAIIISALVLWYRQGQVSPWLPFLCVALAAAWFLPYRLRSHAAQNIGRLVLFSISLWMHKTHPASDIGTFIDPEWLDAAGELAIAEVVIRAYSPPPTGHSAATLRTLPLGLSGLTMVAACNAYLEVIPRLYIPLYVLSLLVGLQAYRPVRTGGARRRAAVAAYASMAASVALGYALCGSLLVYKDAITNYLMQRFNPSRYIMRTVALSEESHLASMFGQEGSDERVMRIKTRANIAYMRGTSMYQYRNGQWGPSGRSSDRKYFPVQVGELDKPAVGEDAVVTRFADSRGMFFAPLNSASLQIDDAVNLRWAREDGGPVRADAPLPDSYKIVIGDEGFQGPLAAKPNATYRRQLLEVPRDLDPRIRALALQITAGKPDALRKAHAIQAYLPAHHKYSLNIQVNTRDPLSDFLFSNKGAHCEFFAAAAVILMRCAGVPARYTVGYFAHEAEGSSLVVRQRDAHAWAEAYIDGKGWVTIDATPSDGRPGETMKPIASWRRALEKLQDAFGNLREKITPEAIFRFAAVVVLLAVGIYMLQSRFHLLSRLFHRGEFAAQERFVYTAGPEGLGEVYAAFLRSSERAGLTCPPGTPWSEYLTRDAVGVSPQVLAAATAFVEAYNQLRFGGQFTPEAITSLQALLHQYQSALRAAGNERKGGQR